LTLVLVDSGKEYGYESSRTVVEFFGPTWDEMSEIENKVMMGWIELTRVLDDEKKRSWRDGGVPWHPLLPVEEKI